MTGLFDFVREGWLKRRRRGEKSFAGLFARFRAVLDLNNRVLAGIASMHNKLGGGYVFDLQYLRSATQDLEDLVRKLIDSLDSMSPGKYPALSSAFRLICTNVENELAGRPVIPDRMVLSFDEIEAKDLNVVGGKSTRLALATRSLGLTVPSGFAVTVRAFLEFMEHNKIDTLAVQIEESWRAGALGLNEASGKIRGMILAGELPPRLRKSMSRSIDALCQDVGCKNIGLAVRSSAWGEDGDHSFAGQYDSFLNVSPEMISDAYRKVLASTYSASAMEYRRECGFKAGEVLMGVSVQAMIQARTSGVVYSLSPFNPRENSLIIVGTWGLGSPVVSGDVEVDKFVVSRAPGHEQLAISVVRKLKAQRCDPQSGVYMEDLPDDMQTKACLSSVEISLLVETALRLERYFKKPMDIEYAFDHENKLVILQARPLHVPRQNEVLSQDLSERLKNYTVLLSGVGDVAQQGVGSGPVFMAGNGRSLEDFPDGAILVAPHSSPQYASILHRSAGVITDVGSPLGHMATIAREYRVPALLNAENATGILKDGQIVTLDAEQKTVYEGVVAELQLHEVVSERIEETYEYRLLRRLLKLIEPLNLIDPTARNFTPQGCLTLHDITRFVHEKAVEELVNIPATSSFGISCPNGRLELPVPIDLMVLDIGGGLIPAENDNGKRCSSRRVITPEQVLSDPMHAFIDGVTLAGVWQSSPVAVDFASFMSSMTRTFSSDMAGASSVGQNLAVISDCYLHLSLRLGYHFTMIDCFVNDNPADNYAYFRFAGGVTGVNRRCRRARFLAEVLKNLDFSVTQQEDLVVARVKKHATPEILRRIRVLGILVAYTRQLDVSMIDDDQILKHIEEFGKLVTC